MNIFMFHVPDMTNCPTVTQKLFIKFNEKGGAKIWL
mgnify:CR=1 FL=1|jgi:hypothetical protein